MAFPVNDVVRIILGFLSAVTGMFFLSKSSFSDLQFSDDESAKATAFSFLTALFIVFLFVGPDLKNFVVARPRVERVKPFVMKSMVMSFSFVIVTVLVFLIKHPRFNVHSEYTRPCVDEQRQEISRGVEYNLFSFIAFAILALIISFERKQPSQLGFFGNLIGLIIDTSMEIKGTNGPNLWYIFGSGLCCILLIFLRCYAETSNNVLRNATEEAREGRVSRGKFGILTCLEFLAACIGITFLSLSSLSKMQFGGSADLKVACFSIAALFLGACMLKLPEWMDAVVTVCRDSSLAKATVNSLLLMIISTMIFLHKYPRFKVHSRYRNSCAEKVRRKITHGSLCDLYSVGTFSFFALVVSSGEHQHAEFGMFSFLLQLTMDVAIETLENEGPNAWYVLGAAVYCVALIYLKIWLSIGGLGNVMGDAATDDSDQGPPSPEGVVPNDNEDNARAEQGRQSSGETECEMVGVDGSTRGDTGDANSDSGQRRTHVTKMAGKSEKSTGQGPTTPVGVEAYESEDNVLAEQGRQSSGETEWEMVGDDDIIRGDIGDANSDSGQRRARVTKMAGKSEKSATTLTVEQIEECARLLDCEPDFFSAYRDIGDANSDSGQRRTHVTKMAGKSEKSATTLTVEQIEECARLLDCEPDFFSAYRDIGDANSDSGQRRIHVTKMAGKSEKSATTVTVEDLEEAWSLDWLGSDARRRRLRRRMRVDKKQVEQE